MHYLGNNVYPVGLLVGLAVLTGSDGPLAGHLIPSGRQSNGERAVANRILI